MRSYKGIDNVMSSLTCGMKKFGVYMLSEGPDSFRLKERLPVSLQVIKHYASPFPQLLDFNLIYSKSILK